MFLDFYRLLEYINLSNKRDSQLFKSSNRDIYKKKERERRNSELFVEIK